MRPTRNSRLNKPARALTLSKELNHLIIGPEVIAVSSRLWEHVTTAQTC